MLSLRVLLSICLIFYQIQPGDAYKSVAYKKNVYLCMIVEKGRRFPINLRLPFDQNVRGIKNSSFQPTITCSKLTIEILEQGVKHVQS